MLKNHKRPRKWSVAATASAVCTPATGAVVPALEILEASPAALVSTGRDHHVPARGVGASTPVHGEGGAVSTGKCSRTAINPASSLAAGVVARSFSALMEILRWIGVSGVLVLQVQFYRFRN
jgi:hypothetical protein